MVRADPIRTSRLDLVPMTPEFLAASLQKERAKLGLLLDVEIPDDWPDEPRWPQRRLDQLRKDPTLQPWLLRAIVLRSERRMIGHIGFHTRPGEEYLQELAPGGVEFGYTVFENNRRRGYAREACEALLEWAHRSHGVTDSWFRSVPRTSRRWSWRRDSGSNASAPMSTRKTDRRTSSSAGWKVPLSSALEPRLGDR
jgi:RimJ/RimL family protein N-acetyltransferase